MSLHNADAFNVSCIYPWKLQKVPFNFPMVFILSARHLVRMLKDSFSIALKMRCNICIIYVMALLSLLNSNYVFLLLFFPFRSTKYFVNRHNHFFYDIFFSFHTIPSTKQVNVSLWHNVFHVKFMVIQCKSFHLLNTVMYLAWYNLQADDSC